MLPKLPGICNAKFGTILKAIHEESHDNGLSRSTFKRMIQKAIILGLITVHETERKNGSQTSNLYVFNPFPYNEPPKPEILDQPKETSNLLKTEKDQKINKRNEEPFELDHTYVSNRVPQEVCASKQGYVDAGKVRNLLNTSPRSKGRSEWKLIPFPLLFYHFKYKCFHY
ncbi:hypothetical protein [Neobacillus niacini]|uniref:hypothetical protein n=1 Tax=Neobacillus niacini TaxID=86668 RepID=UPI0021CB4A2B|nr:hypothetical protein [Neobacillus niacini]MCM3763895.1 hypothetical protein [Neobacillus niacini]